VITGSSAVQAIVTQDADAGDFPDAPPASNPRRMPVANRLETTMVTDRRGTATASTRLTEFFSDAGIALVPAPISQAAVARRAWQLCGRGDHRARLNAAYCFAYALGSLPMRLPGKRASPCCSRVTISRRPASSPH